MRRALLQVRQAVSNKKILLVCQLEISMRRALLQVRQAVSNRKILLVCQLAISKKEPAWAALRCQKKTQITADPAIHSASLALSQ